MTAYVIVQATFHPGAELDAYRQQAVLAIQKYEGEFVVRGKAKLLVEGEQNADQKVIIIKFPSAEKAQAWYASAEYAEALKLSEKAMTRQLFIVEGS